MRDRGDDLNAEHAEHAETSFKRPGKLCDLSDLRVETLSATSARSARRRRTPPSVSGPRAGLGARIGSGCRARCSRRATAAGFDGCRSQHSTPCAVDRVPDPVIAARASRPRPDGAMPRHRDHAKPGSGGNHGLGAPNPTLHDIGLEATDNGRIRLTSHPGRRTRSQHSRHSAAGSRP